MKEPEFVTIELSKEASEYLGDGIVGRLADAFVLGLSAVGNAPVFILRLIIILGRELDLEFFKKDRL